MLSAFACTPSVLANDVPVVTLQAKNIQVHADWQVVGDDADHFRVEGGILMLRPNISGVGYPDGNTITAIVELRDKFSTLNPSYEDLTVRVTLTAVIMGCRAHWYRDFAKFGTQHVAVVSGPIKVGDVIARRDTENNHIFLHIVSEDLGSDAGGTFITTLPDLYEHLDKFAPPGANTGYEELAVNESEECFDKDIGTLYLNANAPLITGLYSGVQARTVIVSESRVSEQQAVFLFG